MFFISFLKRAIRRLADSVASWIDDIRLFYAMWQDNRAGHNIDDIERLERGGRKEIKHV